MKVTSVQAVIEQMALLNTKLPQASLSDIKAFNNTYLIITKGVAQKLGTGFFEHEDVMKKVDITFFDYYSSPLKRYEKGEEIPQAWKILFDLAKENTSFQFLYMALGVNAHVNNDLAQTLHAAKVQENFKTDYDNVNSVINHSLREVVLSLNERSRKLAVMEKNLFHFYAPVLNHVIRKWRENAWQNFLLLKEGKKEIADIEKEAEEMAQKLTEIKGTQHFYKLKNFL